MLFSVFYLSLFLSVGLLSARRAVPDGSAAVIVPLGCGFGVSLLAVLPALFAVVLGFTLPAAALSAVAAWGIGYAVFDSSVYAKFAADESWYAARYDVWYEDAGCRVYKIK